MRRGFFGRVLVAVGVCCVTVLASGVDAQTAPPVTSTKDSHPAASTSTQQPQAQPEATQAQSAHTASSSAETAAPAAAPARSDKKKSDSNDSGADSGAGAETQASNVPGADQHWGMLKQYCSKCHNAEDWAGGVAFDTMTPEEIPEQAEIWEHAMRKLQIGRAHV